jgi:N-succinyldiaminopimelate aminotransferase
MNPNLALLQPYPFEKLNKLKTEAKVTTDLPHIALSIGEPKHQSPEFVLKAMADNLDKLANYPTTKGIPELRQAISQWACKRFSLNGLDSDTQILPVNGTREAIFAFTQAVVAAKPDALVVSPNPFYQIYEGAAYLAEPNPITCHA